MERTSLVLGISLILAIVMFAVDNNQMAYFLIGLVLGHLVTEAAGSD